MKVDEILAEAAKPPEDQRASIASRIIHGLEKPRYWVPDEEVIERMDEAERDPSVMISFEEFEAGIERSGS